MKNRFSVLTNALMVLVSCFSGLGTLQANTIKIYDDSFIVYNQSTLLNSSTPFFSAVFGTYSGGVFNTIGAISESNSGYVDLSTPELIVGNQQNDNSLIGVNTPIFLAIYYAPLVTVNSNALAAAYSISYNRAILTDPLWLAGTYTFGSTPEQNLSFSSQTTAVVGSFVFNGSGSDQITLVPEPTTASLLLLSGFGLVALRRLRKV